MKLIVSRRWAIESKRLSLRHGLLIVMVSQMLDDIPEPARSKWSERLRAIDTNARALYHGHKVNEPHNEQPSQPLGDIQAEVPNGR